MRLMDAPVGFDMFLYQRDNCEKVVLSADEVRQGSS
jgi:hypothetical protein